MTKNEISIHTLLEMTKLKLDVLEQDSIFLACLEQAGVDNWEGYSYAFDVMEAQYPEEYKRRFGEL